MNAAHLGRVRSLLLSALQALNIDTTILTPKYARSIPV